jgi:hypothetical protein
MLKVGISEAEKTPEPDNDGWEAIVTNPEPSATGWSPTPKDYDDQLSNAGPLPAAA